ncbi:MAG: hypothetical protein AAGI70_01960 [Pseudomonadota bacterium]
MIYVIGVKAAIVAGLVYYTWKLRRDNANRRAAKAARARVQDA